LEIPIVVMLFSHFFHVPWYKHDEWRVWNCSCLEDAGTKAMIVTEIFRNWNV